MTHQDWTKQLRDRMADYKAAAPEGLWADIESSLPQPKAKTKALWLRWASAAALIALTAGIGWWLWPREERQLPQETATRVHQQQPHQPDMEPVTLTAEGVMAATQQPRTSGRSQESTAKSQKLTANSQKTGDRRQEIPVEETANQEDVGKAPTVPHDERKTESIIVHQPAPIRQEVPQRPRLPQTGRRRALSVGIHANSGLLAYNHSNGVQMSATMASRYNYSGYMATRSQQEIIWLAGYEERQHHDQPISYGLTVSYPLTRRWAIETGVVYTRLHADFVNIMKQVQINSEQTLHYIGVPLNIQYRVLSGRQWKAYVTAGAEVDWNVQADSKTEGVKTQIKKDDAQWSLGAAVGVEYDIIPQLGIYAEPGLRYYFDNGSKVRNFFKDQPTNWNLQLGIRLNLSK